MEFTSYLNAAQPTDTPFDLMKAHKEAADSHRVVAQSYQRIGNTEKYEFHMAKAAENDAKAISLTESAGAPTHHLYRIDASRGDDEIYTHVSSHTSEASAKAAKTKREQGAERRGNSDSEFYTVKSHADHEAIQKAKTPEKQKKYFPVEN